MYMATAGMVSPYKTTIALIDNAIENGAKVSLNTYVKGMKVENGKIVSVDTNRGTIYPKVVVNCAGIYSDVIADMAGDRTFTIHPRKGTDIILDKKRVGYALSSYARSYFAPLPPEARPDNKEQVGHTKGGGVMRTVDGNILVGPDAHEVPSREDYSTSIQDIDNIIKSKNSLNPCSTRVTLSRISRALAQQRTKRTLSCAEAYLRAIFTRRRVFNRRVSPLRPQSLAILEIG